MDPDIRLERGEDIESIRQVVQAAFQAKSHLDHREGLIVDQLRDSGTLSLSLVAIRGVEVVGHVAVSSVYIQNTKQDTFGWFGLGPLSVRPDNQRIGIGSRLVHAAIEHLKQRGASGCVVLGRPDFYKKLGFRNDHNMEFLGAPKEFLMRMVLTGPDARGVVRYHEAFDIKRL